jgi:MraZ protein
MIEQSFLGQFRHTIDEKGRMTVPISYRELLNGSGYIMQGLDQNLMVYTAPAFEKIYERVNKLSLTDPKARLFKRLVLGSADALVFDKLGRILIPQFLRESNNLENAAVVVGQGSYFEIWSQDYWKEQESKINAVKADPGSFEGLDLSLN